MQKIKKSDLPKMDLLDCKIRVHDQKIKTKKEKSPEEKLKQISRLRKGLQKKEEQLKEEIRIFGDSRFFTFPEESMNPPPPSFSGVVEKVNPSISYDYPIKKYVKKRKIETAIIPKYYKKEKSSSSSLRLAKRLKTKKSKKSEKPRAIEYKTKNIKAIEYKPGKGRPKKGEVRIKKEKVLKTGVKGSGNYAKKLSEETKKKKAKELTEARIKAAIKRQSKREKEAEEKFKKRMKK